MYLLNFPCISGFLGPSLGSTMQISSLLQHVLDLLALGIDCTELSKGLWQQQLEGVTAATGGFDSSQKGCGFSRTRFIYQDLVLGFEIWIKIKQKNW